MNRRGGAKFVSSRFVREKKRRAWEAELDSLHEKIEVEAVRWGIDLSDPGVTTGLLKLIDEMDDNSQLARDADWRTRAEHFLALAYAQTRIIDQTSLDAERTGALCLGNWVIGVLMGMPSNPPASMCTSCIIKQHSSRMGKAGAEKKLGPMRELEQWTIEQYNAGRWPSANQAAHDLTKRVIEHGRSIGAKLSEQNAQRTIADWIRKWKKTVPQAASPTRQGAN